MEQSQYVSQALRLLMDHIVRRPKMYSAPFNPVGDVAAKKNSIEEFGNPQKPGQNTKLFG